MDCEEFDIQVAVVLIVCTDDFFNLDLLELLYWIFLLGARSVGSCLGCLKVFVSVIIEKIVFITSNCLTLISVTWTNSMTFSSSFSVSSIMYFFFAPHLLWLFFSSLKESLAETI